MEVEALNLIGDASYEDGEELNSTGTAMGIAVVVEWRNDDDDDDADDDGFVGDDDDDDDDNDDDGFVDAAAAAAADDDDYTGNQPCHLGALCTFSCPGVTVRRPRGTFLCPGVTFLCPRVTVSHLFVLLLN